MSQQHRGNHEHGESQPQVGPSPVVDIGGDVGAIVVRLSSVPESGELEARPVGRPDLRFHTGVHLRDIGGHVVPAAVYPAVVQGEYEILDHELSPVAAVTVAGGQVADISLALAVE
jgi:hypothetical protein